MSGNGEKCGFVPFDATTLPWVKRKIQKERMRGRTEDRKDRVAANRFKYRQKHNTVYSKRWQEKNPEKRAAHIKVGNAIRDGKLTKQPCEVCSEINVHAHHDDYTKPLDVRWLCVTHHGETRRVEDNE